MKIYKENDELVLRVPLKQKESNPYMDEKDLQMVDNLVGIIAGDDYFISHLIDMSYCGKLPQEGMPIVTFNDEGELRTVCESMDIPIWQHPLCAYCNKAMRDSFTLNKLGSCCFECDSKIE